MRYALIAVLLMLSGCMSIEFAPSETNNKSEQEFRADNATCRVQARQAGGQYFDTATYKDCMAGLGWVENK